ncbi:MAG: hypothetical protein AAB217_24700 [Chloroflexota bacterium]
MFAGNKNLKNLKDINPTLLHPMSGEGLERLSYTKINKLITALYMVTDIIDKDEPLRNKLRTLGIEIILDITSPTRVTLVGLLVKISEVMSFLDIASAINIISEMNCSILKKEFLELNQSIKESTDKVKILNKEISLSEFFRDSPLEEYPLGGSGMNLSTPAFSHPSRGEENSKGHYSNGHQYSTRIGVQKGSTLLKALSDRIGSRTDLSAQGSASRAQDFDILKKQRRNDIIIIIKTIGGNATIKDIKDRVQMSQGKAMSLMSCSEKTLQRELVSMVQDNVLNKTGEKRWSRYFLK